MYIIANKFIKNKEWYKLEKIKLTKSNINLINPNDVAFFSLASENTRVNPSCFEIILKDKKIYIWLIKKRIML